MQAGIRRRCVAVEHPMDNQRRFKKSNYYTSY